MLELVAVLSAVFWVVLHLDRGRAWPADRGPRPPGPLIETATAVIALVPARNEAAMLPLTLPALLSQQDRGFRVLLVDDASEDGTAAVARETAAELGLDQRLGVVEAPAPPAGWSGKVHALCRGLQSLGEVFPQFHPEWILFTDADVLLRRGALADLLARARAGGYDLVSVMARLRAESVWERLLIPSFVFFFQLIYPFRRVGRERSRVAAAAGGCVLVRRRVLEASGGLAAIGEEVIDDVALATRLKRSGARLWLGLDAGIASLRAYPRLSSIWSMVARTAFAQLRYRWWWVGLVAAGLAVFVVSPPLVVAIAGSSAAASGPPPAALRAMVWAGAAWLLQSLALLPSVRHHRAPSAYALALPLAALLFGLMTVSSAWAHLKGAGASWKGRRLLR